MIIPATTSIALRCPACGQVQIKYLSLFSFAGSRAARLECACGIPLVSLETRDRRSFSVQVNCAICDAWHSFTLRRQEIWSGEVGEFLCEDTELEVAFIGPRQKVKSYLQSQERTVAEMAEDLGFRDYFLNSEVMYRILEYLYEIAGQGHLYCQCGNTDIGVEIFPEHLELCCQECGARISVRAKNEDDLSVLQQVWEIRLPTDRTHFKK